MVEMRTKDCSKKRFIPFHIPFIGQEEINAAKKALMNNSLSGNGPLGKELEERFKKYTGAKYAFFTTSCTSAIEIALMALGVSKGDEVVCPSFSFVSIANAIVKAGAKLVFVDIDEGTYNLKPALVKKSITKRTKAIIAVHYAGHSCPIDEILSIAQRYNVRVIEDAAQAIGSFYKRKHLGTIGDIGCLSLHGTKNITCGEGGIFLTNNDIIAKKADIIREKGTNRSLFLKGKIDKYQWTSLGSSYVQSDILAAIAIEQLCKIGRITKRRQDIAAYFNSRFRALEPIIRLPRLIEGAVSNWHIYAIRLRDRDSRDRFIKAMLSRGVECSSHFVPLHTSPFAMKYLGYRRGDYPVTELVCDTLVRIPIYPQLRQSDVRYIADMAVEVIKSI